MLFLNKASNFCLVMEMLREHSVLSFSNVMLLLNVQNNIYFLHASLKSYILIYYIYLFIYNASLKAFMYFLFTFWVLLKILYIDILHLFIYIQCFFKILYTFIYLHFEYFLKSYILIYYIYLFIYNASLKAFMYLFIYILSTS